MPQSPLAIANWFLEQGQAERIPIDPMKLQKLVYLAHGWYLAVTGGGLINEPVEAWPYGPVVPTLYHAVKRFGRQPIAGPVLDDHVRFLGAEGGVAEEVLERVWEVYKGLTGIQLSNMTHEPGTPWSDAWEKGQEQGFNRGADIPNETIRRYFIGQAQPA